MAPKTRSRPRDDADDVPEPSPVVVEVVQGEGAVSELELARLENIRRNEQMLSQLGIVQARETLATRPIQSARKATAARVPKPKVEVAPTRRSTRVTADKLTLEIRRLQDEGKTDEAQKVQEELDAMVEKQQLGAYVVEPTEMADPYQRLPPEPLPVTSFADAEDEDREELAARLAAALASAQETVAVRSAAKKMKTEERPAPSSSFAPLRLTQECVAKLTFQRCTSVALHPSSSRMVAAAGDKVGNVGLWDVDADDEGGAVYRYRPHVSNVMRLHFLEADHNKLHSLSYDGTLRVFDCAAQGWTQAFEEPQDLRDVYLSDASWMVDCPASVLVSKSDGSVGLVDLRAARGYQWTAQAQESRLTSVQQHPTQTSLVVTASAKTGITVHDLRGAAKKSWRALHSLDLHSKSINAAYVSPDGKHLVSVSQDDTIKVTADFLTSVPRAVVLKHNNFTGRWLSTFRPAFDEKRPATFALGCMLQPRRVEVFHVQSAAAATHRVELMHNLQSDFLGSVCSRNCFHKHQEVVLCSNSSGKVHLFR